MSKIALVFPGQGSQYLRMGKSLRQGFAEYPRIMEEASDAVGTDLVAQIFEGTMEELTKSEIAQPAILATSYAFFRWFTQEMGVTPAFALGHSLGEISALVCAGAFSFYDGMKFVRRRGELMQQAYTDKLGGMGLVMGLRAEDLESRFAALCDEQAQVSIAGYNSPAQLLVSGNRAGMRRLADLVEELGGELIPFRMVAMKVDAPYHCGLMRYAHDEIRGCLRSVETGPMKWPVISNVTARPYVHSADVVDLLSRQLTSPVKWMQSLAFIENEGIRLAVELGPQQVLKNLVRETTTAIPVLSADFPEDCDKMRRVFCRGRSAHIEKLLTCLRTIVGSENHGILNGIEFEEQVVQPYREIEKHIDSAKSEDVTASTLKVAIEETTRVLQAKNVPGDEKKTLLSDLVTDLELLNPELSELRETVRS